MRKNRLIFILMIFFATQLLASESTTTGSPTQDEENNASIEMEEKDCQRACLQDGEDPWECNSFCVGTA